MNLNIFWANCWIGSATASNTAWCPGILVCQEKKTQKNPTNRTWAKFGLKKYNKKREFNLFSLICTLG